MLAEDVKRLFVECIRVASYPSPVLSMRSHDLCRLVELVLYVVVHAYDDVFEHSLNPVFWVRMPHTFLRQCLPFSSIPRCPSTSVDFATEDICSRDRGRVLCLRRRSGPETVADSPGTRGSCHGHVWP
jgi:hypothetical protein